jgi:hypothetical protein
MEQCGKCSNALLLEGTQHASVVSHLDWIEFAIARIARSRGLEQNRPIEGDAEGIEVELLDERHIILVARIKFAGLIGGRIVLDAPFLGCP